MERQVAPEEPFEQLRLGDTLEASDEEVEACITRLVETRGTPPAEPAWLREAMDRPPRIEPTAGD